ncbi:rCG65916 [Rattus norvegicus]|uniref:LRRGT00182 n=2 Tax=Rattus norvegicus TaxID=10116 RepID=A0A8I6ALS5_RAT|nr:LRRGT00182 [Rattus norvegicus]EDM07141.1 rCG65916 [Rattus norvegicus]|eukprot:NP_001171297.1 uncharacterized protein LOC100363531 [Rattus norvegicus]
MEAGDIAQQQSFCVGYTIPSTTHTHTRTHTHTHRNRKYRIPLQTKVENRTNGIHHLTVLQSPSILKDANASKVSEERECRTRLGTQGQDDKATVTATTVIAIFPVTGDHAGNRAPRIKTAGFRAEEKGMRARGQMDPGCCKGLAHIICSPWRRLSAFLAKGNIAETRMELR